MSSKNNIEKWLLTDWSTSRSNTSGSKFNGDMKNLAITADRNESGKESERKDYAHARRSAASTGNNDSGAGGSLPNEEQDFSPSASSWEPTDESSSDESNDEVENKNKNNGMQQYLRQLLVKKRHSKKELTPVHRPNAVVKVLQERQMNNNHNKSKPRKRKYRETVTQASKKFFPDSTRKNMPPPSIKVKNENETVEVKLKDIIEINTTFQELFRILRELQPKKQSVKRIFYGKYVEEKEKSIDDPPLSPRSEESNRSDDNVLITNKYKTVQTINNEKKAKDKAQQEWVPIGSGKTLIHKDKYRKVNWKSYTIATRTLLLASFPRRILATHSLTGKRSPAFQNKPAKMCLDPKIVSDVIIEITSRFNVKENLVRSIITTKCADEAKMLKMRIESRKKNTKNTRQPSSDSENVSLKSLKKELRAENK
ncbi:unnamed protein product [Leptosia nina]|uniref:BEN domain-containing protein n=1 Tax=Leptosia nina TaxID=320188 RepID=A0AAV1K590_9NEOP